MRVSDGLWHRSMVSPMRTALMVQGQAYTTLEIQRLVLGLGSSLDRLGVSPGTRVALALPNGPEFLAGFLAAARYGWVAVPISQSATGDELSALLRAAHPQVLIARPQWASAELAVLRASAPEAIVITVDSVGSQLVWNGLPTDAWDLNAAEPPLAAPTDPFYIGFTSGSTGRPKGVVRRHSAWVRTFAAATAAFRLSPRERFLVPGPLHFSASLFAAVHALETGGTLYLESRFNPRRLAALVAKERITAVFMVPTLYQALVDQHPPGGGKALSQTVRCLISCGEKLQPSLSEGLLNRFPSAGIYEYYGSSEVGFITFRPPTLIHRPESVGLPFPGVQLAIKRADGGPVSQGEVGVLCARSPMMAAGYDQEGVLLPLADAEGWIQTGDLARLDDDGLLYLEGRADDAITSGGATIFPAEVEAALAAHPAIAEAAVMGMPHPRRGEQIVAAVVLRPGAQVSPAALRSACAGRLSAHKCPRVILTFKQFPRTETGKIARKDLRAHVAELLDFRYDGER